MSSTGSNQVLQGPTGSPGYASVSWENGDGESIPAFSLDSSIPGKYKSTVSNILSKHCTEVKTASDEVLQPVVSVSKKKLRELVQKHNNEIFSFMAKPDKTPQVIGLAETIFRRYGQDASSIKGSNNGSILRDLNLDVSMDETVASFDDGLRKCKGLGGLDDFLKQTKWIFNQYKAIGEEIIRLETVLYQKIDMLDKLNSRTPMITSLAHNEVLPELIDSFAKYADSVYSSTKIEDTYKELVEAYKKWNICRQIISLHSSFKNETHESSCAICLTDPVSTAIVPCGHTFCGNCVKNRILPVIFVEGLLESVLSYFLRRLLDFNLEVIGT